MSEPTDGELLSAWRDGDEAAGRELFRRHFDSVFRFFRNKVGDAASDLTQQTFLGCVRGKERYRGDSSFRTYVFTIARNRLYTFLRDRNRAQAHFEPSTNSVVDLGAVSPSHVVAARREHRLLLKALRRLSLDMQVAIELHYWEDMTVNEIAEVTGAPPGTIKRRLQRGRERLDELIAELADDDALRQSTVDGFGRWAKELRGEVVAREDDDHDDHDDHSG